VPVRGSPSCITAGPASVPVMRSRALSACGGAISWPVTPTGSAIAPNPANAHVKPGSTGGAWVDLAWGGLILMGWVGRPWPLVCPAFPRVVSGWADGFGGGQQVVGVGGPQPAVNRVVQALCHGHACGRCRVRRRALV